MRGKRLTQETRSEIVKMRDSGVPAAQIARQFAISAQAVQRIVREEHQKLEDGTAPKDPAAPPRDCIDGFTPMYQRIIELNRQRKEIDSELKNILATLRNAVKIAESGDVP